MFIFRSIIIIALAITLTGCVNPQTQTSSATNQSNYVPFKSPDGFKIDLPKSEPSIVTDRFDNNGVKGVGKRYTWTNKDDYSYDVAFYDLDNGKKSLTDNEKKDYLEANKKSLVDALKSNNFPFTDKQYVFNGNEGVEIKADNPKANSKMISRIFIVNKRLYYLGLTYNPKTLEDSQIYQIADSFALIDSESKTNSK